MESKHATASQRSSTLETTLKDFCSEYTVTVKQVGNQLVGCGSTQPSWSRRKEQEQTKAATNKFNIYYCSVVSAHTQIAYVVD